jgi:hypothetical protein
MANNFLVLIIKNSREFNMENFLSFQIFNQRNGREIHSSRFQRYSIILMDITFTDLELEKRRRVSVFSLWLVSFESQEDAQNIGFQSFMERNLSIRALNEIDIEWLLNAGRLSFGMQRRAENLSFLNDLWLDNLLGKLLLGLIVLVFWLGDGCVRARSDVCLKLKLLKPLNEATHSKPQKCFRQTFFPPTAHHTSLINDLACAIITQRSFSHTDIILLLNGGKHVDGCEFGKFPTTRRRLTTLSVSFCLIPRLFQCFFVLRLQARR